MTFSCGRARVEHCVEWKAQRIGMGGGSGDGGWGEWGAVNLDGEDPKGRGFHTSCFGLTVMMRTQGVLVNSTTITTITTMQNFKYITQ